MSFVDFLMTKKAFAMFGAVSIGEQPLAALLTLNF
jgi:hypothetical protein